MKKKSSSAITDRSQRQQANLIRFLAVGGFLTTIGIFGSTNYDPIGAPKLYILSFFAFAGLGLYIIQKGFGFKSLRQLKGYELSLLLFIALLFINLAVNHQTFEERVFGVSARNTGFLTFLAFAIFAFLVSRISSGTQTTFVLKAMFWASSVVSVYFMFQLAGLDIFVIDNYYGEIGRAHV